MKTSLPLLIIAVLFALPASGGESPPSGATEILNGRTYWRFFVTRRPPMVTAEALKLAGKSGEAKAPPKLLNKYSSSPPPAAWPGPDFDDHAWPRSRIKWIGPQVSSRAHTFRISMRGKFHVENPGDVKGLSLELGYRGGVVVYLNGKEVARKHMPEGTLSDETPAELYPNEAWVDSGGKAHSHRKPEPASRNRSIGPVKLDASLLHKGTNVLAVEIRRSDFHPVAMKWRDHGHPPSYDRWTPVGVERIALSATGTGFTPNAGRPAGLQVWVRDRNDYMTADDYGDPTEALYPVRLVGARNGSYCGQIGVGSDAALKGVKVDPSALKGSGGEIPAANVTVLYGLIGDGRSHKPWCDNLIDAPPAEVPVRSTPGSSARRGMPAVPPEKVGAVQPVLVRVKVPKDAKPGEYKGSVSVAAGGRTVSVPVVLSVADWVVPDPRDFRLFVDLYQSPESVAMQYKVEMWSEEHWKLLEKSWELLGRAGNKLVVVHAAEETQFGNPRGTVYWVKKPDGSYDYDFSVFDRYLEMAKRHCGKLDHVAVQVWHVGNTMKTGSGWGTSPLDQKVTVTVKNGSGLESLRVPAFATEESRKFWKPFLAAVDRRIRDEGHGDALCLGILWDSIPKGALFKTFDEIWPGGGPSRWMRGCHVATSSTGPYPAVKRGPGQIVLHEYCYGGGVRNPRFGEARNYPGVYYFRASNEHRVALSLYLAFGDYSLWKGTKGVGRICLDNWPVLKGKQGRLVDIINRYPYSDCMQRRPTISQMSWPGPEGAMPTMRLEAFIEGIQASEAVIVIAEALEKHRAKLGSDLAAKCEKLLADRSKARLLAWSQHENRSYGNVVLHPTSQGWQELSKRTYQLAAEVTARTK